MKNHISQGVNLTLFAPEDVSSGDPVLVGNLFGIAAGNAAMDEEVDIVTQGIFRMNKVSALAIMTGDAIYYDDTTKLVSKTDTDVRIGAAMETVLTGVTTIAVRLDGFVVTA